MFARFVFAYENIEHVNAEPILARVIKYFQLQNKQEKFKKVNQQLKKFGVTSIIDHALPGSAQPFCC